jgi:S1-C subfamily serine protease
VSSELEPMEEAELAAAEAVSPTFAESVQVQLAAERSLWRAVAIGTVIAVPVCVGIWVAIVALAVGGNSGVSWGLWLGMGAIIGLVAGGFFGGLFAFVTNSHVLDDADRHAVELEHQHQQVLSHH